MKQAKASPDGSMLSDDGPSWAGTAASIKASASYRRYALWFFLTTYTLNFVDRQIVTILAEPIKTDLDLADWQIGALTGLAFALFYTLLGFPVARLAETGDRPRIIAAAVGIWSLFTGACGLAQTFTQLALARVGVGIGEAGCTPTAVSLIADYTPPDKRAGAMAVYTTGSSIGSFLGMAIGGVLAAKWGWRSAFFVAGTPGLAMAALSLITLKEPRRFDPQRSQAAVTETGFRGSLREALRSRALRMTIAGAVCQSFLSFGFGAFLGSFVLRNHADDLATLGASLNMRPLSALGFALGIPMGLAGIVGGLAGGLAVNHYGKGNKSAYVTIPAFGVLLAAPCYAATVLSPSLWLALLSLSLASVFGAFWFGPCYAVIQGTAPPKVRATATAALLFCSNLFGLGLGPVAIGILSDLLNKQAGYGPAHGMKLAMLACTLAGVASSYCFWTARRSISEDLRY